MAEYLGNNTQNLGLNDSVQFTASIPCTKGNVFHEDGTGIFILRGNTPNCFARYDVTYTGNIAVPTGGAVTAIATAITVNGEIRPTSTAVFTPQAVNEYGQVVSKATITVPRGCCFSVAARYVDATTDNPAVTPTPTISAKNSSITITRTA